MHCECTRFSFRLIFIHSPMWGQPWQTLKETVCDDTYNILYHALTSHTHFKANINWMVNLFKLHQPLFLQTVDARDFFLKHATDSVQDKLISDRPTSGHTYEHTYRWLESITVNERGCAMSVTRMKLEREHTLAWGNLFPSYRLFINVPSITNKPGLISPFLHVVQNWMYLQEWQGSNKLGLLLV